MAHLVLPDTQADPSQNQKSHFSANAPTNKSDIVNNKIKFYLGQKNDSINLSKLDKSYERNDWTIHKNLKK
jgi:hypothetical protein